jgi:SAM-dependent methyltransferase
MKGLLSLLESSKSRKAVIAVAEGVFVALHSVLGLIPGKPRCPVCAARLACVYRPVLSTKLVREWNIGKDYEGYFNNRDGEICLGCGSSIRGRQLGLALLYWLNQVLETEYRDVSKCLKNQRARQLCIAEINSCGGIHHLLKRLPNVFYSEYESSDSSVRHEDLLQLSYNDATFDLVLHSDTIEHVPDIRRALSELWRVLKPGGAMIFSIPIGRDGRDTLVRAKFQGGQIKHVYPPSYHGGSYQATNQYLVFYEFGLDFLNLLKSRGFTVDLLECPGNPAAVTFTAIKPFV